MRYGGRLFVMLIFELHTAAANVIDFRRPEALYQQNRLAWTLQSFCSFPYYIFISLYVLNVFLRYGTESCAATVPCFAERAHTHRLPPSPSHPLARRSSSRI
jgi:hypothetical protein